MFTAENTEGFTATDLELLNKALEVRIARGEREKNASDAINNAWFEGCALADLTQE